MDANTIVKQYLIDNDFEELKGFEGLYKINKKAIWSCCYNKVMKLQSKDGYLFVNLGDKEGKKKKGYFHRLLAIQYIKNPDNLPEIDHIDRNRQNNDLSNLRWADKTIQNNNKSSNIANLTEEEKNDRIIDMKEYKREWAEKDRRTKGIEPKNPNFDNKAYQQEWMKNKRANRSQEEIDAENKMRRETRPVQTEEQKEKARERARKQRENKKK